MDSTDYIGVYARAEKALAGRIDDMSTDALALKHSAVLALARAGATDLAQEHYNHYGLSKVTHDEDIMALSARLSKDYYFKTSGKTATNHARDAAHKYDLAFKATGGYYSGINAATMALAAGMPDDIVRARAKTIRDNLPDPDGLPTQTLYFIEATRAESLMILDEAVFAKMAIERARSHDPLNYTAHAATLKQLRLIAKLKGIDAPWLSRLIPPKALHFAGHLFEGLQDEPALKDQIIDTIQQHDIGFGYGALAAGSDIVIAEALLEQGGDVHIILPVAAPLFRRLSVAPFGGNWTARFDSVLAQARTITLTSDTDVWPDAGVNAHAARIAMGLSLMKAESLGSSAAQLLVWDSTGKHSYTAQHAKDWGERERFVIDFPDSRPPAGPSPASQISPVFRVATSAADSHSVSTLHDAITAASKAQEEGQAAIISADLLSDTTVQNNEFLAPAFAGNIWADNKWAGTIIVTQDIAGLVALNHSDEFDLHYAGSLGADSKSVADQMTAPHYVLTPATPV